MAAHRAGCTGVRAFVRAKKPGNSGGTKGRRKMDVEMKKHKKQKPASVPSARRAEAQQAGKAYSCWRCAQPCVWTIRMLTTLISGVKGGRWFRLFDKVFSET